jgi:hypothetical protein
VIEFQQSALARAPALIAVSSVPAPLHVSCGRSGAMAGEGQCFRQEARGSSIPNPLRASWPSDYFHTPRTSPLSQMPWGECEGCALSV